MTTIERTAYPRFKRNLTTKDLDEVYTPTPGERFLAARSTKGSVAEVGFLHAVMHTEQWLNWTRFFAPLSGHASKLDHPSDRRPCMAIPRRRVPLCLAWRICWAFP